MGVNGGKRVVMTVTLSTLRGPLDSESLEQLDV
jgi:hypothetical protein